jgi:hypothetical protein
MSHDFYEMEDHVAASQSLDYFMVDKVLNFGRGFIRMCIPFWTLRVPSIVIDQENEINVTHFLLSLVDIILHFMGVGWIVGL